MKTLTWSAFTFNVQQWAKERGIYQHSTPNAQLLKALSELGELADAIIKGDRHALKDGIGDVAVCIVNYAHMENENMGMGRLVDATIMHHNQVASIAFIAQSIGALLTEKNEYLTQSIISALMRLCDLTAIDFAECCSIAWHEIKDRKGKMVTGGAFVKEG